MDIFSRLHLRRPPSSTKKSRSTLLTPDIPEITPRPVCSFNSSLPPSIDAKAGGASLDATRSVSDRPVYTPGPTTLTPKSRTPSLLRSLQHHPSLAALKSKRKSRAKLRELGATPDLEAPVDQVNDRPVSRLLKKRSLKASKSIPSGLRMSGDSEQWRASEDIPPLPSSSIPSDASKFTTLPSRLFRPSDHPVFASPGGVQVDCQSASPERGPSKSRLGLGSSSASQQARPYSADLSPARGAQLSPPRRLSTPASPSRINITTPPRLYLPSLHPHPVPLGPSSNAPRFDQREDSDVFDEDDFEPVSSGSRSSKEDGLDILRPEEELPTGTPGGTKADLQRGALIDGQRPEKGAIRFFSRDMYWPVFNTPSPETTPPRNACQPQLLLDEPSSKSAERMAKRSSSPFEIKLAPNVTKRMSLDAFGASPTVSKESGNGDEEAEELLDELEEPSFEAPQSSEDDQLTYFHGTQLSTIQESEPGEGDSWNASRILQTPRHPITADEKAPGPPSPFLPPRQRSASAVDDGTPRSGPETLLSGLHREVEELKRSLLQVEDERSQDQREREAAERLVLHLCLETEEKEQALQRLRDAMRENEEIFDNLQEAHDNLALQCAELRAAKSRLEHQLSVDSTSLRSSQSETSSLRAKLQIVERTNGQLIRTLAEAKGREAELAAASKEAEDQVHAKTEDLAAAIATHEERMGSLRRQLAERDAKLAQLRDDAQRGADAMKKELQLELRDALVKITEKDGLIADLRDKLQTARFQTDEKLVSLQVELNGLQTDNLQILGANQALKTDLEAQRQAVADLDQERREWQLAREELLNNTRDAAATSREQIDTLQEQTAQATDRIECLESDLEDALERLDTANSALSFQDQELATLRETAFEAADTANRISDEATAKSKEADRIIQRLREEVEDLQFQLNAGSSALQSAVTERELAKSQTGTDRSRLDAYLAEIDRLKLSEASLSYQLETLQRQSATDELGLVDLRRQVERLEEDKELLNVALESKQTELTLLQRQLGPRTAPTTPRTQRTAAPSRIPQTPTRTAGILETPKRIAPSTSTGSIKFARRESSVIISTPRPMTIVAAPASASRVVLGSTTRHNRTPEKAKSREAGSFGTKPAPAASTQKGLKRQSSLPVLSSRLHARASGEVDRKVASLTEEDEELTN